MGFNKNENEFEKLEQLLLRVDFSKKSKNKNKKKEETVMRNKNKAKRINKRFLAISACVAALAIGFSTTAYAKNFMELIVKQQFKIGQNTSVTEVEATDLVQQIDPEGEKANIAMDVEIDENGKRVITEVVDKNEIPKKEIDQQQANLEMGTKIELPKYIPEGFADKKIDFYEAKGEIKIKTVEFSYGSQEEKLIYSITRQDEKTKEETDTQIQIITNEQTKKEIIDGIEVGVVGQNTLFWEKNDFSYSLHITGTNANYNELVKVFKSIKK